MELPKRAPAGEKERGENLLNMASESGLPNNKAARDLPLQRCGIKAQADVPMEACAVTCR